GASREHARTSARRGGAADPSAAYVLLAPVRVLHRSQGDREAIPLGRSPLPAPWRDPRDADPLAMGVPVPSGAGARPAFPPRERRGHRPGDLPADLHDPWPDHDLLRRHAGAHRLLRQLPHPAHDRRAGHGVPEAQHVLVLDLPPLSCSSSAPSSPISARRAPAGPPIRLSRPTSARPVSVRRWSLRRSSLPAFPRRWARSTTSPR